MKNKNKNSFEPVVEQGYKKKYIERLQEEEENKNLLRQWQLYYERQQSKGYEHDEPDPL